MTETTWSITGGRLDGEKLSLEAANALLEKPGAKVRFKDANHFTITTPAIAEPKKKHRILVVADLVTDRYFWFLFGFCVGYICYKFNL